MERMPTDFLLLSSLHSNVKTSEKNKMGSTEKVFDIVILTEDRYLENYSNTEYASNVIREDQILLSALETQDLRVERKSWSDPLFDWASTHAVIFRTTWDYFDRFDHFSTWLESVSKQTRLFNSEGLIRWNMDKHYLQDLEIKGVRICETQFIETGDKTSLADRVEEQGWSEVVVKPCVSGAGRHTYRLSGDDISSFDPKFQQLLADESFMIQPFQKRIVTDGEMSLMLMGGKYTHAVLKRAKSGDFRVQDDYGGSVEMYHPTDEEIAFAQNAVQACPELPLYARVDVFYNNAGQLALAELELIEPELWFRLNSNSAEELADVIAAELKNDAETN